MDIDQQNIKTIFDQFASTNLPPYINSLFGNASRILKKISLGQIDDVYHFDQKHEYILNLGKNVKTPKYIYKNGSESIKYYAFKNNLTLRPMGIGSPIWYFAFAYNILVAHDKWLKLLYLEEDDQIPQLVSHSDLPILTKDLNTFQEMNYDTQQLSEYSVASGFSNELDNKSSKVYKRNQIRNINDEGAHPFYMKVDIEGYFRNIYTHQLSKLANLLPYRMFISMNIENFFNFLDTFNMKISDNQTKGILQGPFSSQISAEFLGISLDLSIAQAIKDHKITGITFRRYVDDFTFYGNNQADLNAVLVQVDRIFRQYGVGRKTEKTIIERGFPLSKGGNFHDPIFAVNNKSIFGSNSPELTLSNILELRQKLGELVEENNISQIRTILTVFKKEVVPNKIKQTSFPTLQSLCQIILKTAISFPVVSVHCYRVLDDILMTINPVDRERIILNVIELNTSLIDEDYPETELQIWHYYILGKYLPSKERAKFLTRLLKKMSLTNADSTDCLLIISFVKDNFQQNQKIWKTVKEKYQTESKLTSGGIEGIETSRWFLVIIYLYQYARSMSIKKTQTERINFKQEILKLFSDKRGKIHYNQLGIFKEMLS